MSTVIGRVHIAETTAIPAGRLVVLTSRWRSGTVTVHLLDQKDQPLQTYYAELKSRKDEQGTELKAAGFPLLPPGNYMVHEPGCTYTGRKVTVFPGAVAEVDFR